ncbi:DNA-binding protein [Ectopseudomonas hydrolytica]|uniref:DNA-binding protein n=1 Tax=Ectopseudomonas hydrolytica TaxID=2493633 RepID=UPI0020B68DA5|nr:DNA-binding protein [Pseudomonas hydrolytica]UTH32747.1 DNA-binding protein [Pseudomonas hydrolytica]
MSAQHLEQPPFDVAFDLDGKRVIYLDCRNALLCSKEVFAMMMGVSDDTVVSWMQTGTVPSVKMGRPRVVNLAKLRADLAKGKTVFAQGDYGDE